MCCFYFATCTILTKKVLFCRCYSIEGRTIQKQNKIQMKQNYLLMGAFLSLMAACGPKEQKETLPENPTDGQVYSDGKSNWVWNYAMGYWMIRSMTNRAAPAHYYYPSTREWSQSTPTNNGGFRPSGTKSTTPPPTLPPQTVKSSYKANTVNRSSAVKSTSGARSGGFGTSGTSSGASS